MTLAEVLERAKAKDPTLTEINLEDQKIGPEGMKQLAALLPDCLALSVLRLGRNNLGAEGAQALARVLPACSALRQLYLYNNNLGAEGVQALASVLPACSALSYLNLSSNNLGAEGAQLLATVLPKCTALSQLWVGNNKLGSEEAKALASVLPACSALRELYLSGNNLGSEGAKALASVLPACSSLSVLWIASNKLGAEGAKTLARVLPACSALIKLDIGLNDLGSEGTKELARILPECSSLRELHLCNNQLGIEGAQALASVLPACRALSELLLGSNNLGVEGAQLLASVLPECHVLSELNLYNNNLGANGVNELMKVLPTCNAMSVLTLSNNNLGAEEDKIIQTIESILKENRKRHQELIEAQKEAPVKVAQPKAPEQSLLPVLPEVKQIPQLPHSPSAQSSFATPHDIVFKVNKISYQQLSYGERIGKGSFGIVYQGKYSFTDVAIKEFLEQHLTEDSLIEFKNEAMIMGQSRHPNIVTLYGICLESPHYSLVMELMPNHSLWDFLHTSQEISWEIRSNIALDITAGLAFLHDQNILHRDLKSLNVLLDGHFRAKITDFGLSKIKTETRSRTIKTKEEKEKSVGTLQWMAPELFELEAEYTKASDIYSYGMILWELSTRKVPFAGASDALIIQWVSNGKKQAIPKDCPEALAKVINECWQTEGQKRITAAAALKSLSLWKKDKEQEKAAKDVTSLFAQAKLENPNSQASSGYRENVETKEYPKGNSP